MASIDTNVIHVHNINKYEKLIENLRIAGKQEGFVQRVWLPHEIEVEQYGSMLKIVEHLYQDSSKRTIRIKDSIELPSSHYTLSWMADFNKERIIFNFSVPKLVYGHNIAQFVAHQQEFKYWTDFQSQSTWKTNIYQSFDRYMYFLERFRQLFLGWVEDDWEGKPVWKMVELQDIEINRLDLCFNQIFETKQEAMEYLELQKKIKKRGIRENTESKHDWRTSIWIRTDRYSAKIYHKGSEYRKNDMKEHIAKNGGYKKNLGGSSKQFFDLELLTDVADRTLRYEITFRGKYMSYLHKQYFFRSKCGFWQKLKIIHDNYKAKLLIIQRAKEQKKLWKIKKVDPLDDAAVLKRKKKLEEYNRKIHNALKYVEGWTKIEHKEKGVNYFTLYESNKMLAKIYMSGTNKITRFFLKVSDYDVQEHKLTANLSYSETGIMHLTTNYRFNKQLFLKMASVFKAFFDEFQVFQRDELDTVVQKVHEYNRDVEYYNERNSEEIKRKIVARRSKITVSSVKKNYILMKDNTLHYLVKNGFLTERQYYNVRAQFKKLGISLNQFSNMPIYPPLDYYRYHSVVFNHMKLISKNRFFIENIAA